LSVFWLTKRSSMIDTRPPSRTASSPAPDTDPTFARQLRPSGWKDDSGKHRYDQTGPTGSSCRNSRAVVDDPARSRAIFSARDSRRISFVNATYRDVFCRRFDREAPVKVEGADAMLAGLGWRKTPTRAFFISQAPTQQFVSAPRLMADKYGLESDCRRVNSGRKKSARAGVAIDTIDDMDRSMPAFRLGQEHFSVLDDDKTSRAR